MSIFVRQLEAINCEAKFDRHCNWIVSAIAWNAYSFSSSLPLPALPPKVLICLWFLIGPWSIWRTSEQTKDKRRKERESYWGYTVEDCLPVQKVVRGFAWNVKFAVWFHFSCSCGRCLSVLTLSSAHLSRSHIKVFNFSADRESEGVWKYEMWWGCSGK